MLRLWKPSTQNSPTMRTNDSIDSIDFNDYNDYRTL